MTTQPRPIFLELEQLLLDHLGQHGSLEIYDLEVRVREGVAYIAGCVPNLKQKRLAGEIADQVEEVREVVNMLKIEPMPVVNDGLLSSRLKQALVRNPRVDEAGVSITMVNGVVHIGGFVTTEAEKRLVEEEAWGRLGVRFTINNLEVPSEEPKSDIQIVGQILQCYSSCLGLDLSTIEVEFSNGNVHLRGTVPSEYLKSAAEELARWTPRIVDVVNELRVFHPASSREV